MKQIDKSVILRIGLLLILCWFPLSGSICNPTIYDGLCHSPAQCASDSISHNAVTMMLSVIATPIHLIQSILLRTIIHAVELEMLPHDGMYMVMADHLTGISVLQ